MEADMTKAAAIQAFWSGFGLTAMEEHAVPSGNDAPSLPYLTYSFATGAWTDELALSASLWYRTSSWKEPNAKAEEISRAIGRGGVVLKCDGGVILIRRGTPFAQSMGDDGDSATKRKYLNITAEYLTAD